MVRRLAHRPYNTCFETAHSLKFIPHFLEKHMKQKNSKTEQYEIWDAGTYQTGNTTPPKSGNPLVSVLLMLVILLGGLLSAMGIINLRLLAALQQQQPVETVPILLQPDATAPQHGKPNLETAPSIPDATISMELKESAKDTDHLPETDVQQIAHASLVTVQVADDAQCTGLVLSEKGYILTFAHLVCDADRILVTLPQGQTHRAALVGYDAFTDLAVLYIRATGLTPAVFSDGKTLSAGSKVNAFCGQQATGGTVFAADKVLDIGGIRLPLVKTSAATGEIAGSLWDSNGQVIGIISPRIRHFLKASGEDTAYVIPSVTVKSIVDQLLRSGFVAGRPSLGAQVEEITDIHQNYWKLPDGLRITHSVNPQLRDGDILISLNGREVADYDALFDILFSCHVGQQLQAVVYRDGKTVTVALSLGDERDLR